MFTINDTAKIHRFKLESGNIAFLLALPQAAAVSISQEGVVVKGNILTGQFKPISKVEPCSLWQKLTPSQVLSAEISGIATQVKLWNFEQQQCETLAIINNTLINFRVFADQIYILFADSIQIVSMETKKRTQFTMPDWGDSVLDFAVLSEEKIITGCADGWIKIWNLKSEETTYECEVSTEAINRLESLSNDQIVYAKRKGLIGVLDIQKNKIKLILPRGQDIMDICELPEHKLLCGYADGCLELWDTVTWQCLHSFQPREACIKALAAYANGNFLVGYSDGVIDVLQSPLLTTTLKEIQQAAYLLRQAKASKNSPFYNLPQEILYQIAAHAGEAQVLSYEARLQRAVCHFNKQSFMFFKQNVGHEVEPTLTANIKAVDALKL